MAVVVVATFAVKPDRFEDEVEDARQAKVIFEKCGGKNIRLLAALVGGEVTGSLAMTIEADDFASWGAVYDNFLTDPEGQALAARIGTSASPLTGLQTALWMDVSL